LIFWMRRFYENMYALRLGKNLSPLFNYENTSLTLTYSPPSWEESRNLINLIFIVIIPFPSQWVDSWAEEELFLPPISFLKPFISTNVHLRIISNLFNNLHFNEEKLINATPLSEEITQSFFFNFITLLPSFFHPFTIEDMDGVSFSTQLNSNLKSLKPTFFGCLEKLNKNVIKNRPKKQRHLSRYRMRWRYLFWFKRDAFSLRFMAQDLIYQNASTLDHRLYAWLSTYGFNPTKTRIYKFKKFSYTYVFKYYGLRLPKF
jgi:hypothetical protein